MFGTRERFNRVFGRIRKPRTDKGTGRSRLGTSIPDDPSRHRQSPLTIPSTILIGHVFAYLDRRSQNRLCVASKDVYDGVKLLGTQQAWPEGTFPMRKVVFALAFSPGGNELAIVTSNSKSVSIWNRQRGFDHSLHGHQGQCSDVAYAPSNEYLVTCSRSDGSVRLWKKPQRSEDGRETGPSGGDRYSNFRVLNVKVFATLFVRVSSNGRDVASFGDDGTIYLSNADDGTLTARTPWRSRLFISCYDCVAFPTLRHDVLAHTFNNQTVRIWNWSTQYTIGLEDNDRARMVDYEAYITSLQFFVGGGTGGGREEYLAVGCRVAKVKIWSLEDYTCVQTINLGTGWSGVTHLQFNALGTRMACTGEGSQIRLYDVASEECLHRWVVARVNTLSFSPDGKTLAGGGCDRTMRLWTVPA